MNTRIIDTADAVVRRYKTRNPEEIISQRAIKLKDIRFCHDLLGYYTVLLNCEYIGINPNCTAAQRISALAHELGHALFDRKHASSGQAFQDTYFYSLDNSKAERRANIFASELLLSDDDILKPIGYYEFNADRIHLETNMPSHASAAYRAMKYQELLQEFLYTHGDVLTPAEIAQKIEIEKHFVDFKLNILAAKGYQLPVLPELHNDFLKDSMKNSECKLLRIMLVQILLYSRQFHSLSAHRHTLWMPGLLHQQCEQSSKLLIDSHISYVIRRRSEVIKVCQD